MNEKKVGFCSWGAIFTSFITNTMEKSQKMSFWQVVKRLLLPIKYVKLDFFWYFLISIYLGVAWIFQVQIISWIVWAVEIKDWDLLKYMIVIFIIYRSTIYVINILARLSHSQLWVKFQFRSKEKLLSKFIKTDNNYIEKFWTWRMNNVIDDWLSSQTNIVVETIMDFFVSFIWAVYSFYLIFSKVSLLYSFLFLFAYIISLIVVYYWNQIVVKYRQQRKEAGMELDRFHIKLIMSKFEIFQNNKFSSEIKKIKEITWKILWIWRKENLSTWISNELPKVFINWINVFVFVFVWFGVINWTFSIWEFVLLNSLTWIVFESVQEFVMKFRDYAREIVNVEKMRDIFDNAPTFEWSEDKEEFTYKSWNIKIQNMSFWYDKSPIFQNFNLELKWWTKTAFVGESWGGKTTLIKLLAWYIRPDNGEIEIDGQKLSEIKLTDYYKHIGYLTQDPSVFDGTIYENLVYALDSEPPKEDLEKVVKLAKCEFIREFEKGLETEIGERWVRLSGWQKQRLAIAKIMLKNPNIILLDEPTSALDSFNEDQISIALHNLFKGKTVIVVAHRLQTVKQADRILLFEQGKILEEGTHDELVKVWWKYKKMLDLQSGF
jgi:ATP-binding cassette, subfamily B, bacterial